MLNVLFGKQSRQFYLTKCLNGNETDWQKRKKRYLESFRMRSDEVSESRIIGEGKNCLSDKKEKNIFVGACIM